MPSEDTDFRLKQLEASERFETWRAIVEPCFSPTLNDKEELYRFDCDFSAFSMNDVVITHSRASAQSFKRTVNHLQKTGWDHIVVQHYTQGGFVGEAGGRDMEVTAGDINIFDLGGTLATEATDFSNTTFILPRERFPSRNGLHGLVLPGQDGMARIIGHHMDAMARFGSLLSPSESDAALEALALMVARSRMADASLDVRALASASLRDVVVAYIDKHLGNPNLDIAMIAAGCNISRATLYRLFLGEGGIARYVLSKRLDLAFRLLIRQTGAKMRIAEICYRCGFTNETHFSRVFRLRFGMTPRDARHMKVAADIGDRFYTPHAWVAAMRRYREEIG